MISLRNRLQTNAVADLTVLFDSVSLHIFTVHNKKPIHHFFHHNIKTEGSRHITFGLAMKTTTKQILKLKTEIMKKLFIATLIMVAAGTSAFALDANKVTNKVRVNFEAQFSGAKNIIWSARDFYIRASFVLGEENIEAFFGSDGDLIGTSRKVALNKLPLNAVQKIEKEYATYKVTDSILFEHDGEKTYYVSLEDGQKKQIIEVSIYGDVNIYKSAK
jgi:hypothetical protein